MPVDAVAYVVKRSARRTVGLCVERDGHLLVRAPESLSDASIAAVVAAKQTWILRAQARWAALNPQQPGKEFVSGETVYFLGQPLRMDFRMNAEQGVQRHGDVFVMRAQDRHKAESLLREFYRAEGLTRFPALVRQHAAAMDVAPGAVRVLDLGLRWSSCSDNGTLNFNWKTLAAPLEVLHYLVVHELAHLRYRNHSAQFWQAVTAEMPDWSRHANWLSIHGAELVF